jgi:hypothetical protein
MAGRPRRRKHGSTPLTRWVPCNCYGGEEGATEVEGIKEVDSQTVDDLEHPDLRFEPPWLPAFRVFPGLLFEPISNML